MPRALLLALAVLAAPTASGQPTADGVSRDRVAVLPPFRLPHRGDFAPPQTSALRAYAYSAGVTAGTVALGYVLYRVLPTRDPTEASFSPSYAGELVMIVGAVYGTAAGNVSLGAAGDVTRATYIRGVGLLGGVGALVFGLSGSGEVFTLGYLVMGAGLAGGIVYDLATIPRNAARARHYRRAHPRVAVAPGWQSGGPALGLRVGL